MVSVYRSLFVWAAGIVVVLGTFLYFVATGWPGSPDPCILASPDDCFCEAFSLEDVHSHAAGVRQPVNTWFNLYAVVTSLWVALVVCRDRKALVLAPAAAAQGLYSYYETVILTSISLMRSESWIPDVYVFAILFLGLGSMWFHASLTSWAENLDCVSMYLFATFPAIYTARRLRNSDRFFWLAYPTTTFVVFMLHLVITWKYKTLVLIGALVIVYLVLEMSINVKRGKWWGGRAVTISLWWCGLVAIGLATLFWALSQTGQPLCDPSSRFQAHGMLWHPLAGLMAALLFFYWRLLVDTTNFDQELVRIYMFRDVVSNL